ncbi:MAG: helix-turn-helix transcriptional regulator [Pirellulales bacterium]
MKKTLSDQLRIAVLRCEKTRYQISRETGIAQSILSRFINDGAGLSLANIDKLCESIGARLVVDPPAAKRKGR